MRYPLQNNAYKNKPFEYIFQPAGIFKYKWRKSVGLDKAFPATCYWNAVGFFLIQCHIIMPPRIKCLYFAEIRQE